MSENTYLCRCEDVSINEIRDLINKGITCVEEIKRITRCGMGPCGGRTCGTLIINEIAKMTNTHPKDIRPSKLRPPAKNVKLGSLAQAGEG